MSASKPSSRARRSSGKPPAPQEQYKRLFTPQPDALKGDTGRFEIFSLTDFSIPVYLAGGSGDMLHNK
jgi:hypothetical protein